MSYDITFRVQEKETNEWVDLLFDVANTTWNVTEMICKSTGLEWNNEEDNGYVKDIIPKIEKGRRELIEYPEKYRKYESPNGWGTIDGTIGFFSDIIKSYEILCNDSPKLAEVAKFWII